MTTQSLTEHAMALALEDRVLLAAALWESIGDDLSSDNEKAVIAEALRRDAELASGASTGRTHDEVMLAARRAIGCE